MKIRLVTLISRELRWLFITIFLFLLTGFLCESIAFVGALNEKTENGVHVLRPSIGTRGLGLSHAFISGADDATSPLWKTPLDLQYLTMET